MLNIDIIFKYYGGIPVNKINAFYPISGNNLQGFQKISDVSKKFISIGLLRNGYYENNFGNSNIYIKKIKQIDYGYINQNEYKINLNKNINNIIGSRIISSEFPNSEKVFKDHTSDSQNNKLYWQNLDDGDKIYSISIESGNYTTDELITLLEKKFYDVEKINYSIDENDIYTKNNYIKVTIDIKTDIVTFTSYNEAIIKKPFIKIKPEIIETDGIKGSSNESYDGSYQITINHLNHNLVVGDTILIRDAISFLGISANLFNVSHKIKEVISVNSYIIELNNINLNSLRVNTGGGNGVKIYVPNKFRMRFDFPDTMGLQLGFRNIGNINSITKYNFIISNQDKYENEIDFNDNGKELIITNNSLLLSGSSYILIDCPELNGIYNYGLTNLKNIKNIFGKINLSGLPGKIIYNSFVPFNINYESPIKSISELTFRFYTPEGKLFDFNNLNHSFVIEFTCLDKLPEDTNINVNSGRIY